MKWLGPVTTGIGTLPFASVSDAIAYSFSHDVPFLPQLPVGHPEELMLAAAMSPGPKPIERGWVPFLEAVARHRPAFAKVQLTGPVTLERYAQFRDPGLLERKALHMVNALSTLGVRPIVFIDEPGLGQSPLDALEALLAAIQETGALTGVHCCGATNWAALLNLAPLDVVSFDVAREGRNLAPFAGAFTSRGGTLAFGLDARSAGHCLAPFGPQAGLLLTTTCGLANSSLEEAASKRDTLQKMALSLRLQ